MTLPGNIFFNLFFKNGSNSTLVSDVFHMKSQFYKLFKKLVTGFGGGGGMRDQTFIICTFLSL